MTDKHFYTSPKGKEREYGGKPQVQKRKVGRHQSRRFKVFNKVEKGHFKETEG